MWKMSMLSPPVSGGVSIGKTVPRGFLSSSLTSGGHEQVTAKKKTTEKSATVKKTASEKVKETLSEEQAPRVSKSAVASKPAKVSAAKAKTVVKPKASKLADKKEVASSKTEEVLGKTASTPSQDKSSKPSVSAVPAKVVPRASLASLFGGGEETNFSEQPPEWVKPEWVKYYKNLYMLRSRIKNQMSGLAEGAAQEVTSFGMHMADTGTDHFDRDFALSLLSADQDALYEVEQALKRIQKGTYGVCEMTGKPIPKSRLEAIPWTRFTVEAQAQLEKEGTLNRRRLGTLGTITAPAGDESGVRPASEDEDEGEDKLASDKE